MKEKISVKKPSILIVDDEPKNIQVLGNLLMKNDYHVEFATSGKAALKWVESHYFDLILLDIMMPEMSGFEVCRKLKASPETRGIPIIFLTARTEDEDVAEGFANGGVDYICKPFNGPELLLRINAHLEIHRSRRQLARQNEIKNEVLRVLSHDLVSSLGAITPMINYLKENPEDSDAFTAIIKGNISNAMKVVDLTRQMLSADEKPIHVSAVNLKDSLHRAMDILESKRN